MASIRQKLLMDLATQLAEHELFFSSLRKEHLIQSQGVLMQSISANYLSGTNTQYSRCIHAYYFSSAICNIKTHVLQVESSGCHSLFSEELLIYIYIYVYTLQGINISHLGKRNIIFKMPFLGDMLVSWRVYIRCISSTPKVTQICSKCLVQTAILKILTALSPAASPFKTPITIKIQWPGLKSTNKHGDTT